MTVQQRSSKVQHRSPYLPYYPLSLSLSGARNLLLGFNVKNKGVSALMCRIRPSFEPLVELFELFSPLRDNYNLTLTIILSG